MRLKTTISDHLPTGDSIEHSIGLVQWGNLLFVFVFCFIIFRHARVSSTYPCQMSVRPSVGNTFGFPICQRLWSPYVKIWRERTPIIFVHFPKVYFLKVYFPKMYFPKMYFPKVYFTKVCLLSFASLLNSKPYSCQSGEQLAFSDSEAFFQHFSEHFSFEHCF